jgi:lipopolysaccharide/colanic/teichoic acid biosynthesis glycosyltransferase
MDKTLDSVNSNPYLYVKRSFDFLVVAIGLITLAPIFIVISILIKLESLGPAIFKQKRAGKNGKIFTFYKFRSMYTDCDETVHQHFVQQVMSGEIHMSKLQKDPRITKVGRFLRKGAIDELPQIINVLKGDMSLVGPRPHPLYEVENYKDWHRKRLTVLPGITGLWQINKRNSMSYDQAIQMDLDYIENMSFLLDIKILLKTFLVPLNSLVSKKME